MTAATGLADLVRSLAALPPEERLARVYWDAHAELLGLERAPEFEQAAEKRPPQVATSLAVTAGRARDTTPRAPAEPADLPPVPFWRAVEFDIREDAAETGTRPFDPARQPLTAADLQPPRELPVQHSPPIERWSRLWPRLAAHLRADRDSRTPDSRALVRQFAQALPLHRIPRRRRRAWAERAIIVHDRAPSQAWLIRDQAWLSRRLRQVMGTRGVEVRLLPGGPARTAYDPHRHIEREWSQTTRGTPLLVMSSFTGGTLARTSLSEHERTWRRLGRTLRQRGYAPAALVAGPAARAVRGLSQSWRLLPWERHSWLSRSNRVERQARAERLLALAAPAIVVSSALLRALRTLLAADEADVGTEADAWAHADVEPTPYGLRYLPERAEHWLQRFAALPDILQIRAWRLIRQHQQMYGPEVNHLSTWRLLGALDDQRLNALVTPAERQMAIEVAQRLSLSVDDKTPDAVQMGLRVWFRQMSPLLPDTVYSDERVGAGLTRMWLNSHDEHERPPATLDPWQKPLPPEPALRDVALVHRTGGLWPTGPGSPVARMPRVEAASMRCNRRAWNIESDEPLAMRGDSVEVQSDMSRLRLERLTQPEWASAIGRDRYGLWVACELATVTVRMRWIPPGRFLMGSPEDEPGRYEREGPQHEVIITRGYWLAETACTQALWTVVMGDNPSHFKSPTRPVESVSFQDAQTFLVQLNERTRKMWPSAPPFRLPTEAEWEYACRAGTREATYAGPIEIRGENDAPILDDIAWYGGNSGEDFELNNGYDSSDWPEKQYPHQRAGTHPVAQRGCNPWGLYDMLGNVWEWCHDSNRSYSHERWPERYERVPEHADRVIRGGSWLCGARLVRAACRYWSDPSSADVSLGFRLARGPSSQ